MMDLFNFSPAMVGFLVSLSIGCFLTWNYFEREKKQQTFLTNRIRSAEEEMNLKRSPKREAMEKELENLNNPTTYDQLISKRNLLIAVGLMMILFVNGMGFIGGGIILLALKFPDIYIAQMKAKREKLFLKQFPDAIDQLLNIMKVGLTPVQGYKILSEEAPYPCSKEFEKIYSDINTGAPMEKVLLEFYQRYPTTDIKLFRTGMLIASKASAKVAINTLQTISKTIKRRNSQTSKTKSLTAQGSITAIVMGALPIFAFIGIATISDTYVDDIMSNIYSQIALVVAFILDAIGFAVAQKITSTKSIVNA